MPVFVYRAVTEDGKIVRNRVDDISRKSLIKKLMRNGLTPIDIVQTTTISFGRNKERAKKNTSEAANVLEEGRMYLNLDSSSNQSRGVLNAVKARLAADRKITNRDLVIFTQDFYLLKKANFNNIHALSTIIDKTENLRFKEVLKDILAGVEAGENMYTTMEYYSDVFPYIYINMVKVGEMSGSLTKSLEEAVAYLDETEAMNKRIRGILLPNILLLIGIIALLFIGILFVIPQIQNVFDALGSKESLPAITLWFADFTNKLIKYWYIPLAMVGAIATVIVLYIRTPKGHYNFDYFKYTMPLFGKLIFSLDFLRLARAMLLNLKNGIRIQEALEVSKNVTKNSVMRSLVESAINNMIVGQSWIDPFEQSNLASPMIIEMLNIGMQTDLQEMLEKLLEYMEIDINNTIAKIMKALPEIVYAVVGVFLIFLVVVVLVPCIQAYMGGWLFSAAGVE